ncbi:ATP-binding protein [Streptomyces tropicalis]|uniref:ATP-binding protein n=1 Tax=Streptomyces tropicalis TaxID=3034234 RepID=A0ABT6A3W4_9ACTN|nr:ATP-binding protein [Streptomyces tropicalis]MDF3299148.1 ATP-binding protein [Streptomyces tropicalis]
MEPLSPDGCTSPAPARLRTAAALPDDGACIAEARHLAAEFLSGARAGHGLRVSSRAEEVTQLVVSELVTNARKYAPGPVLLELRITEDTVEVVVEDSDPVLPVPGRADPERVGSHGLEIVRAVSQDFVVRRERAGKRVSARVALRDEDIAPHPHLHRHSA